MGGYTQGVMDFSGTRFRMGGSEWQSLNIGDQNIAIVGIDPRTLEGLSDGIRLRAAWNATAGISVEALEAGVIGELVAALEGLIDDEPCWYDHHGYCQAHFVTAPCEMAIARATSAKVKGEAGQ